MKGVRNRLMNRMKDQNQEDILKDKSVIDGLFGYTAYYHHKNKEDE
ncbi:hypothetical protein IJM86_05685 [bacterium]|nr:hypothetical protein [bacterium]